MRIPNRDPQSVKDEGDRDSAEHNDVIQITKNEDKASNDKIPSDCNSETLAVNDSGEKSTQCNGRTDFIEKMNEENGGKSKQCNNETKLVSEMDEETYETRTSYCRYFATCGGSYLHIYEAQVPGLNEKKPKDGSKGKGGDSQVPSNGLHVRQVYRDLDKNELYYACAFGGRGIGRTLGFEAMRRFDEDGNTVIIDARSTEYDNGFVECNGKNEHSNTKSRKRPRESAAAYQSLRDLSKYDGPQLCFVAGKVSKNQSSGSS